MGEVKWTQDQQKVIDLRDTNILVSAAAGSGKTAVLVERIIQEVTQGESPIDIDRLLVVTFTKAAAAEMRQRVGKAMEKSLIDHPKDKRLQRQLSLLHNAQITTIDSFCQNIIRNYFHVINLDPVFRVADETEIKIMKQEILQELLEQCYEEAALNPEEKSSKEFLAMVDMLSTGRDDKAIEGLILDMYNMSQSAPWPEDWLNDAEKLYVYENVDSLKSAPWVREMETYLGNMLSGYLERASQTLDICYSRGPAEYADAIRSDIEQLKQCVAQSDFEGYRQRIECIQKVRLASSKEEKEVKEAVQNMRKTYMDSGVMKLKEKYCSYTLDELADQLRETAPAVKGLVETVRKFTKAFAEKKRAEAVLDFSDMEHFALQILIDHEHGDVPSDVAKELKEYYQEIMIDEYQDSSYIQEALLSCLSRAQDGQKPYLFMVGDVKQSIYRFRQARPELFNSKYEAYDTDHKLGQRIDLHQNFRSRKMVLDSANYLFRHLMQKCLGGIVYDEAASLVLGADFPDSSKCTAGKSEVLVIQENREFMDKDSLEAAVIGERIRDMVQGKEPLYIYDNEDYRPINYRDIVILLRSPSKLSDKYIEVLSSMGIPAYCETKTGYFSALEVEIILDLLRVIDNPRQDIALAAVMRSVLGGFTDSELAQISGDKERINYYDVLMNEELPGQLRKKVSDFWSMIQGYRELSGVVSVYELLQRVYRETGYYDIMSAMPAGEKRAANLDLLLQKALDYAQIGNTGIFSFIHYIESMKKSEIDFGEASLINEGMNAVRIMSIHKSKGLEFPVVFLAGTGHNFNQSDAKGVVKDNDYGMAIDYINLQERYKTKTILKNYLADRSVAATMAEEIRVLYVALTRAKEKLIITGTVKKAEEQLEKWTMQTAQYGLIDLISAKNYISMIMPLVCKESASVYFQVQEWDSDKLTGLTADKLAKDIVSYEDLRHWDTNICYNKEVKEEIDAETEFVYPYEAERDISVKISVTELKKLELQLKKLEEDVWTGENPVEEEIPRPGFLREKEKVTGAHRGTVYHLIFEHLPYESMSESTTTEEFSRWIEEFACKGYLTKQEKEIVRPQDFCAFLRTELGKRMAAASAKGALYREQQFMMGVPASTLHPEITGEEDILVQGIIDAWFLENDEIILVDYKTDYVKTDLRELEEKYSAQLRYYAEALERVTGKKVREKIIYSVAKSNFICIS